MAEPCRPQLDIIVGERRLDSFGKLATRPTTTVFSTCLPSLGRTLYQWKIQTLPSFLRFCLPSYASAWSTSPFATFQPSVPVAPGTDRGELYWLAPQKQSKIFQLRKLRQRFRSDENAKYAVHDHRSDGRAAFVLLQVLKRDAALEIKSWPHSLRPRKVRAITPSRAALVFSWCAHLLLSTSTVKRIAESFAGRSRRLFTRCPFSAT